MAAYVALAATAYDAISSSSAKKKASRQTKEASDIDAALQEAEADQADLEARANVARIRSEGRRFLSTQRTQIAGAGVVGSEGSPLDAIVRTAGNIELQALEESRAAYARKKQGYARAAETRRTGVMQAQALKAQATGTLLAGAAQTAGTYIQFKQEGLFGGSKAPAKGG